MSSRKLDKFYTKPEVVLSLIQHISFCEYDTLLEPSAGSGNFSNILRQHHENVIAIDIKPDNEHIQELDFLNNDLIFEGNTIAIGNPPFGKQCSLAVKFFNKAASYQNISTIAFILPKSFKKESIQNKLDRNFTISLSIDLEKFSFLLDDVEYDVPSVFQIWNRTNIPRQKNVKRTLVNTNISFIKKKDIDKPVIAIRRVGINAGKATFFINQSKESHYFLCCDNLQEVIDYLNKIIWEHNDTTGPRSISKQQFIDILNAI